MADILPQDDEEPSSSNWLTTLFKRPKLKHKSAQTQISALSLVNEQSQQNLIKAAGKFHLLKVADVMVPRIDIVAVEVMTGLNDLSCAFRDAGHSRLPVFKESLDDPIGMVHIKDLLPYLLLDAKGRHGKNYAQRQIIPQIKRDVLYVPPSMTAQDLLRRMQARRIHMAIVVDEYGGTDGIVTLEDLVEPIVGDIEDEHDESDPEVKVLSGKNNQTYWEADARVLIDEFEKIVGYEFASQDEEEDVDTLGGLVFTLAGRVPERGEIIPHDSGLEFEVIDGDARRLKCLRIQKP